MFKIKRLCVIPNQCCFLLQDEGLNKDPTEENKSNEKDLNSSFQKNVNLTTIEILKLTLVVIDTVHMVVGTEYEISPQGLKFSKRSVKDGCVYAGSLEKQGRAIVNDLILPEREKGIGRRHFMINYNKGNAYLESGSYLIKDMGEGLGTFIRVDRPVKIKNSYIFSFGDSHLIMNIVDNELTLRFIEGPKADYRKY